MVQHQLVDAAAPRPSGRLERRPEVRRRADVAQIASRRRRVSCGLSAGLTLVSGRTPGTAASVSGSPAESCGTPETAALRRRGTRPRSPRARRPCRSRSDSSRAALGRPRRTGTPRRSRRRGSCRDRASRSGACAFSSGSPTPNSTDGSPRISWNVATTGIEPPSRLNTGALPKPFSIARPAACTNGLSNSVIHGLPPCIRVTFSSTVFGATFRT